MDGHTCRLMLHKVEVVTILPLLNEKHNDMIG